MTISSVYDIINIEIRKGRVKMKRCVIILAYKTTYNGVENIYDYDLLKEIEENELFKVESRAYEMNEEINKTDPFLMGSQPEYWIYRQKDESILTCKEIQEMVDSYGTDIEYHSDFQNNFYRYD